MNIRKDDTLYLSGITDGKIKTLGSIRIFYMGYPLDMHVVQDNFPIPQEGILGSDFLQDASKIDFKDQSVLWQGIRVPFSQRETVVIPARSRSTFYVRVGNPDVLTGYIPRLSVCKGVYLGEAMVTNRDGRAYLYAINASDTDRELIVPTINLQEVNQIFTEELEQTQIESNKICAISSTSDANRDGRVQVIRELLRLEHLNNEESEHVATLIETHSDLFRLPDDKLGHTYALSHKISTTDDQPIHTKQYRFPPIHKEEIDKQVKELLNNDIIKPSESPYNSPLWIVPKKADSKGNKRWRMVIDYRSLNEKTIGDAYPLPNITEILDQLGSAKYFSVFDLASGFHQIPMHESHAQKTAFSTPHGHYEFKRMPFGLKNAPATFQRLMDQVLCGLQGTELFVYLDDIVLYASSLQEHKNKFDKLAERLRKANLKLQPDKCEFLRKEVGYLGHIISDEGVKPDPAKIRAVKEFPKPHHAKNIKQFLGLAGYYRRFIHNFSKIAQPLTNLLKKDEPFVWQTKQEEAFVQLRDALCTEPILQYPDFTKPFVVTTDASGHAIGGILSQGTIGKDLPIAYSSRLLNNAERNYSTIEKELLAIVYCVNYFRPYLYGRKFYLVTDHKPLVWLHSVKDPTSRLVRWRLKLAEYEYEVVYKAGKTNVNADALSRNPARSSPSPVQLIETEQILPLGETRDTSSSNESLFPSKGKRTAETPPQTADDRMESDAEPPQTPSDRTSETEDDDSSDSDDENLFDNVNEPFVMRDLRGPHAITIPDNFTTRKDNLVVFTTQQGAPIDQGARMLQETKSLPMVRGAALARAREKLI
ncbi:enzymatic polyprotein endonuclease reverse [Lasius niger]|uniref:Enzymatic polyprotein endonuclease reverse n=1 Tax=Lasius niger TaxID=67767 RepID=A0A0J7KFZ4_LASNI|nr:enzymatic polyprotein endonuclease reverse [Lasius niger]